MWRWRDAVSGSFVERGNPSCDVKRKPYKWKPTKGESIKACMRGGSSRSSVEILVMRMEQRGCAGPKRNASNCQKCWIQL